ncbi:helix-turn-helix domain-containing protein [Fusibacter bizertensis]|uniref:Helix-turn-helix domain-containing protein n=1 Tax=Fusibacter bizertensis TaxID=1488331 RepID=A0ABT6NH23_9FIRM|nr:helix-turn-helix domain-containing protein [Fusibacter bizertensis]MDH8679731.1 helix-turn-helix domain-containing protein [Fusibacter bizertensis]
MSSVTGRIKSVEQPRGGYISIRKFSMTIFNDDQELSEENIHSSLVGLAVDYLFRFMITKDSNTSFDISLKGAEILGQYKNAVKLLKKVTGLDDESIVCACKLSGYDVCYRAGISSYKPVEEIEPDKSTIENIRIMVKRCIRFSEKNGPIIEFGFTFEGAYTEIITTGDGDFLTEDTLWDLKVISKKPNKNQTLQILVYYLMGKCSNSNIFSNISKIGIFNPRLNEVYCIDVSQIDDEIINEVSLKVIGYGEIQEKTDELITFNQIKEYTTKEVAEILNLKTSMIYKLIKNNTIKAYKKGNRYYISSEDLEQYVLHQKRLALYWNIGIAVCALIVVIMFISLKLELV